MAKSVGRRGDGPRVRRIFGLMKMVRAIVIVALLAAAVYAGYRLFARPLGPAGGMATVYYVKPDGDSLVAWHVSLRPGANDPASVAFYVTVQTVAGPPPGTSAIRFPAGTVVRTVHLKGPVAAVDLGGNVATSGGGSFSESGEFKALVWSLTALPKIAAVQVTIDGARVASLPGGHFELDEPLTRKTW